MAQVTVLSRSGMEDEQPRPGVVVISITDPGDPLPLSGWDKVFRFEFDDCEDREAILAQTTRRRDGSFGKLVAFTEAMARSIMSILAEHPTQDIIVHCNAGVSRSVAVARFISEETGRKALFRGNAWTDENANGLVLRLLHRQVWFGNVETGITQINHKSYDGSIGEGGCKVRVYKYPLNGALGIPIVVELPAHSKILTVGIDDYTGYPALWARVDEKATGLVEEKEVLMIGTGFDLPHEYFMWRYICTYKTNSGLMVWHCFVKER